MLSARVNPFAAIGAILIIALTGAVFVIHQIHQVDFTYVSVGDTQ